MGQGHWPHRIADMGVRNNIARERGKLENVWVNTRRFVSWILLVAAIGGGLAGNEVEKNVRAETIYTVRVRMDDGTYRTVTQKTPATVGARVTLDGQSINPS